MSVDLEKRVEALERQVARLQQRQSSKMPAGREWLDDLYGKFAHDSIFAEAMKLGRKYRQSLRPRPRKSKSRR
jgi:hypothetical protein